MIRLGPTKLLYASGAPIFDPPLEIRRILWAQVAEETKQAVLGGNALQLSANGR